MCRDWVLHCSRENVQPSRIQTIREHSYDSSTCWMELDCVEVPGGCAGLEELLLSLGGARQIGRVAGIARLYTDSAVPAARRISRVSRTLGIYAQTWWVRTWLTWLTWLAQFHGFALQWKRVCHWRLRDFTCFSSPLVFPLPYPVIFSQL